MKTHCVIFFLLVNFVVLAQSDLTTLSISRTPLKADRFIGVDKYDDIYYINENSLYKNTPDEMLFFKDFQLGRIGSVDILNPLKVTLYYPNHNVAVILDSKLNEIQRISFSAIEPFSNIANATTASENSLWIFNEDTQQLELYHYRRRNRQTLSTPISEKYITQQGNFNFCFVLTEEKLRLYNIYGSFINSVANDSITFLSENNNRLLVEENGNLFVYSENLNVKRQLASPEFAIKDLYLRNEIIYLYDGEFVHKLKLTPIKK